MLINILLMVGIWYGFLEEYNEEFWLHKKFNGLLDDMMDLIMIFGIGKIYLNIVINIGRSKHI